MALQSLRDVDDMLNKVGAGIKWTSADRGGVKATLLPHVPDDPDYYRKAAALGAIGLDKNDVDTQIPVTSDDVSKLEDDAWIVNWYNFNKWVADALVSKFDNPAERKEWLLRHYPDYFELQTRAIEELKKLSIRYNTIRAIGAKTLEDLYFMFDYEKSYVFMANTLARVSDQITGVLEATNSTALVYLPENAYETGFYNPRARVRRGAGLAARMMGNTDTGIAQPRHSHNVDRIYKDLKPHYFHPYSSRDGDLAFINTRDMLGSVASYNKVKNEPL